MIDLGLGKLMVVGAVAMLVVGPERLPTVARMAGKLYGRATAYLMQLKDEVSRAGIAQEAGGLAQELKAAASDPVRTLADDLAEAEQDFSAAIAEANAAFSQSAPASDTHRQAASAAPGGTPAASRRPETEGRARRHRVRMSDKPSSAERWFRLRKIYRERIGTRAPAPIVVPARPRGPEGIWKIS